ncbi:MAG: hypothetical protein GIS02_00795 [Methanosarcinales archaeon]|uniref:KEOPS complex subunit Pcc1 n=1 Tax=Candidatus Ethanoperedens thermophilum TaxID=2766897 RepID=A0A848D6D4_9EURY|nr:hypothetical protein [Candidatus Ethanoperedens thermophilum]
MIHTKLTLSGECAQIVQRSLEPDNLSSMHTSKNDMKVVVQFEVNRIGTLLSTIDDYLMNAKIAEDLCNITKTKK